MFRLVATLAQPTALIGITQSFQVVAFVTKPKVIEVTGRSLKELTNNAQEQIHAWLLSQGATLTEDEQFHGEFMRLAAWLIAETDGPDDVTFTHEPQN